MTQEQAENQLQMEHKPTWQARLGRRDPSLRVHLLGIGGTGLSAIAKVLLQLGVQVSGSDRQVSAELDQLAAMGALIFHSQVAANLLDLEPDARPDVVLLSSAVAASNPEWQAAQTLGLPLVKRSEFLPALLANRRLIAVAGTHGKTTTTAMTVQILRRAGIDCGYIIGAEVPVYGNGAAGSAPEFVLEADEYDHMFLGLRPQVAVITNVEWDHPDCYPTPASFRRAFMQFSDNVDRDGVIIACVDDPGATHVHDYAPTRGPRWLLYGTQRAADLRAINLRTTAGEGIQADLEWWNAPSGHLQLAVAGVHNVRNALAALAVAATCDIPTPKALAALADYQGSARRFEWKGAEAGVTVIDDYAHHPTEVTATLAAARQRYPDQRIWAVFQPHTYSRTRHMLYQMGESFDAADEVIVLDIYAAREVDDGSVNATELVAASPHRSIRHIAELGEAAAWLKLHVAAGDVVLTLGAGDGYRVGEQLLAMLRSMDALPDGRRSDGVRSDGVRSDDGRSDEADGVGDRSQRPPLPAALGVEIRQGTSLAPYTSMKVGGPAQYFATVSSTEQMIKLARWARASAIPYYILGGGSNILVADEGIRGLVIYNRCRLVRVDEAPCCVFPQDDRPFVFAESGALMAGVARTSIAAGLTGLEWAVSVPGTVGGAVVGNAGAHGLEIKDNLWNAMILSADDMVEEVDAVQLAFAYRSSSLKQQAAIDAALAVKAGFGPIVLNANFRLSVGPEEEIKARADQYLQHRRRTQPVEPSVGSTFRNPPGDYAGRLIEAAGLKGARIGGVAVSELHANFLVNRGGGGGAHAADVLALMQLIQAEVQARFGVLLESEVQLVGEWPA